VVRGGLEGSIPSLARGASTSVSSATVELHARGVEGSGISCASGEVGGEELSDREYRDGKEPNESRT
jgi:hypothetical protein